MNLFKQLTLKSIFLVLLFASTFGSQVLAQCTGQKFRTIRHGTTLLSGASPNLVYGGSQPAMGCITTTKTDIVTPAAGGSLITWQVVLPQV